MPVIDNYNISDRLLWLGLCADVKLYLSAVFASYVNLFESDSTFYPFVFVIEHLCSVSGKIESWWVHSSFNRLTIVNNILVFLIIFAEDREDGIIIGVDDESR